MIRPWQVWLVFIACVAGAAVGMVWLTQQALKADQLRREAEAETELEQRVSLALWRMDTQLAPLVAEEVIRPPSAYRETTVESQDFQQQEEVAVQQDVAVQLPAQQAAPRASRWRPSVLFTLPPEYVVLYFEVRPDGTWHSPQVPETRVDGSQFGVSSEVIAERSKRLEQLAQSVKLPELLSMLPDTPLPSMTRPNDGQIAENAAPDDDVFGGNDDLFAGLEDNEENVAAKPTSKDSTESPPATKEAFAGKSPNISKAADFEQRGERYQTVTKQSLMNLQQRQYANAPANADFPLQAGDVSGEEQIGVSRPVWLGDKLILARRVDGNGETVVQGCWLDWTQLKERLLAEGKDLLPDAELVRADGEAEEDPSRMLAGLPVRLVVNEVPAAGELSPTLRWALWMGWGAAALAVLAAAALLHGVMTLSERRAAFVSSVTHELRTPLTTFRIYAEMLARGMVPDAARRQEYFDTLQREAERLTLLVENVLAYARLERGRKPQRQDRVTLKALLDRVVPRLAHRAAQADMQCDLRLDESTTDQEFVTDQSIVEQIVFNLVDNAAKYARPATNRQIHIDANRNGPWVCLVVRDHGPGMQRRSWTGRLQPFNKTAEESAETAPGVGLGLALCRRLARQLGGHLDINSTPGKGTTAILRLPVLRG
jgi:signal transduction histidine kinase